MKKAPRVLAIILSLSPLILALRSMSAATPGEQAGRQRVRGAT